MKVKIPWYLNIYFILTFSIISIFAPYVIVIPITLSIFHFLKEKKIILLASKYQTLLDNGLSEYDETATIIEKQKTVLEKLNNQITATDQELNTKRLSASKEMQELDSKIKSLRNQYVELDELVMMQDFGLYEPRYDMTSSEKYKQQLDKIRDLQKSMIKAEKAGYYNPDWQVNGSKAKGKKMNKDSVKLALRSFNNESEVIISKVTVSNIQSSEKRLIKSYQSICNLFATTGVGIHEEYLKLKIAELYLALEYAQKVEEEKEEQRQIREQMREEEKVRREIERLKEKVMKEETHFLNALAKLEAQKKDASDLQLIELELKIKELQEKLLEVEKVKEDVLNRERNTRAGYVYIISNIGSFGEDIYKIGMTRRLEPMDRVRELGDASVPFLFDVHALIFSEDAPKLENVLHQTFSHKRLNLVNERKEFFNVTIEEIKDVVEKNHDKTVEFQMTAIAEHYRESQSLRNKQLVTT